MRCNKCPLFSSWNTEYDKGEACAIFGEDWGNSFQYENKEGTEIVGCYIDKAYIKKVEKERDEHEQLAEWFEELKMYKDLEE